MSLLSIFAYLLKLMVVEIHSSSLNWKHVAIIVVIINISIIIVGIIIIIIITIIIVIVVVFIIIVVMVACSLRNCFAEPAQFNSVVAELQTLLLNRHSRLRTSTSPTLVFLANGL